MINDINHYALNVQLDIHEGVLKRDSLASNPTLWWLRSDVSFVPFTERCAKLQDYARDFVKWLKNEEAAAKRMRGDDRGYILWIDHEAAVRTDGFLVELCRMAGIDQQLLPFLKQVLDKDGRSVFRYATDAQTIVAFLEKTYACMLEVHRIGYKRLSPYNP